MSLLAFPERLVHRFYGFAGRAKNRAIEPRGQYRSSARMIRMMMRDEDRSQQQLAFSKRLKDRGCIAWIHRNGGLGTGQQPDVIVAERRQGYEFKSHALMVAKPTAASKSRRIVLMSRSGVCDEHSSAFAACGLN